MASPGERALVAAIYGQHTSRLGQAPAAQDASPQKRPRANGDDRGRLRRRAPATRTRPAQRLA
jgi:hypothetical protein